MQATDKSAHLERTPGQWAGLFARGMAMGVAEVVPGVSGGTIAFVAGIYDELVSTLAGLSKRSPLLFFSAPVDYWRSQNLSFLLALGLGMVVAVLLFARLFEYLLQTMPPVVWGFFFGLIAASVVAIGARLPGRFLLLFGVPGVFVGLALSVLVPTGSSTGYFMFFVGGAIAVSAWLLPAVSGSFMLLALGLYAPVLAAVNDFNVPVLACLLAGIATGLLLFSRLLEAALARWHDQVLALLTGFMLGALPKLWPWRVGNDWLWLDAYEQVTGDASFLFATSLAVVGGVLALYALNRMKG